LLLNTAFEIAGLIAGAHVFAGLSAGCDRSGEAMAPLSSTGDGPSPHLARKFKNAFDDVLLAEARGKAQPPPLKRLSMDAQALGQKQRLSPQTIPVQDSWRCVLRRRCLVNRFRAIPGSLFSDRCITSTGQRTVFSAAFDDRDGDSPRAVAQQWLQRHAQTINGSEADFQL